VKKAVAKYFVCSAFSTLGYKYNAVYVVEFASFACMKEVLQPDLNICSDRAPPARAKRSYRVTPEETNEVFGSLLTEQKKYKIHTW